MLQQAESDPDLILKFCVFCHLHLHPRLKSSSGAVVPTQTLITGGWGGWYIHLRLRRGTNPWQLRPSGTISVALLVVWYNRLPSFVLEIVLISPTAGVGGCKYKTDSVGLTKSREHDTAGSLMTDTCWWVKWLKATHVESAEAFQSQWMGQTSHRNTGWTHYDTISSKTIISCDENLPSLNFY